MDTVSKAGFFEPAIVRMGVVNGVVLTAGLIMSTLVDMTLFPSFLAGWLLALVNLLGLWWTIKRGVRGAVKRVKRFAVMRYYLRFGVTIGVIGLLVIKNLVNPWCLLLGFTVTSASTIIFLIHNARRGAFNAS
ncbi:MAG: ATP synthase subunit I [Thermodesulfobacteriota bacterium]